MSQQLFVSSDVFNQSLGLIDNAIRDWAVNATLEIYKFPDADITIVVKDSGIYLMSKRETFRKKIPFTAMPISNNLSSSDHENVTSGIILEPGSTEVDIMNKILSLTTG